ncbi:hypothetical protein BOTBODRAFT_608392 [Botryobasidium botryosum FD-172 SS1]|uniref:Uncharacterized protein n=1 Tax=Botryobasidium botryosum (strain FD-172 SS1) TaxID=930990 RepID=A0A067LVS6_BOTB1|nr:hypothetical protein BOTBODRAFT_608392 [Botryobasidium botryosum FD-172 SS1]
MSADDYPQKNVVFLSGRVQFTPSLVARHDTLHNPPTPMVKDPQTGVPFFSHHPLLCLVLPPPSRPPDPYSRHLIRHHIPVFLICPGTPTAQIQPCTFLNGITHSSGNLIGMSSRFDFTHIAVSGNSPLPSLTPTSSHFVRFLRARHSLAGPRDQTRHDHVLYCNLQSQDDHGDFGIIDAICVHADETRLASEQTATKEQPLPPSPIFASVRYGK